MAQNEQRTKVTVLTGTYQIKGYIDLLPGARITDYMREASDFIAVCDAEVRDISEGMRHVASAAFLDVNRSHIQIVIPS